MAGTTQLYGEETESIRKERQAAAKEEDRTLELRLGPPVDDVIRESAAAAHTRFRKGVSSNPADTPRNTQKRSSPAPVVGWPPVRSFRKNIASSFSSKQATVSPNKFRKEETNSNPDTLHPVNNNSNNHLFVKIYVEGFPIGRKVNLRAYDSYEKLSLAIDELFGGLLAAAQNKPAAQTEESGTVADDDNAVAANGEHTLVYEDHEGDRILVGDVPWNMFVSTVKKLRVLRSSSA